MMILWNALNGRLVFFFGGCPRNGHGQQRKDSIDLLAADNATNKKGPLQEALTKRKGTITVIAEYWRKLAAER